MRKEWGRGVETEEKSGGGKGVDGAWMLMTAAGGPRAAVVGKGALMSLFQCSRLWFPQFCFDVSAFLLVALLCH